MYKILIGRTPRELSMEVNLAIKAGYNLYGEFTITDKVINKTRQLIFYQAVYREE